MSLKDNDEIVIRLSKAKSIYRIVFSAIVFAGALWTIIAAFDLSGFDRVYLIVLPSLLLLTFGSGLIISIQRIISNKPGILINEQGIIDYFGVTNGILINWSDIIKIIKRNTFQNRFILIFVKNPDEYLDNSNRLNKFFMKMNRISHKTPLSLTTNWLKCDFDELYSIIDRKINKGIPKSSENSYKNVIKTAESNENIIKSTELNKIKKALTKLQIGSSKFNPIGATSDGLDCIWFTCESNKFNIEFEAITEYQKQFLDKLKDFANSKNFKYIMTTYNNKPKFESTSPAPVIRIETNSTIDEIIKIWTNIQVEVFCNKSEIVYDIVP